MKFFRKIFCETKITWKLLIIYSVLNGVIVGLLNCVPFLEKTSLVAPAVTYEYWFVAALFIITNCKRSTEAMIKTFLFFLISQPLIYLVEVPFKALGWGLFGYYKFWAFMTVLTIPGAWIAYQVKRDNILSAIILSVATGYLAWTGFGTAIGMLNSFPYGLITVVFCIAFCVILIQAVLQKKKTRIAAYISTLVFVILLSIIMMINGSTKSAGIMLDSEHEWSVCESDIDAEINGAYLNVTSNKSGTFSVTVKNEAGETIRYEVCFGDSISITEVK